MIVVGAGITGLSTAYAVQKAGGNVLVLEASDHVGGRIMTRERNGDKVEVGQQYLLSTYDNALALIEELGMSGELIEESREAYQYIDKKGRSHVLDGETDLLRLLGVRGAADLARATLQLGTLGKPYPTYDLETCVEEYDNVTANEGLAWAGEKFRDFVLRPMCYGNAGTSLDHLSLFDATRMFRSHLKKPKHFAFRQGNLSFPKKLAEQVPVVLNVKVSGLLTRDDTVVGVQLADGRSVEARHVILCTTPDAAARITPEAFTRPRALLDDFHHSPLALAFFHLDRPVRSAGVSFGIAYPEKRFFNLSINHTVTRPFLVPSGKAIISAWSAYPDSPEMLAKSDEEIAGRAFEELKLFYPGLSHEWIEHNEVVRHAWGYSRHAPGDCRRLLEFRDDAARYAGLSYANADYNLVSLESGIIMGKRAAARAMLGLKELA
ncbi:protoporphyrinogen/coproporphyrinogen oxidase [Sphingopyxis sp. LC81]|uniref:protoporphyrinogen/coproporphyrinogen oxidase n=1 Tax=Sphingopyxis sp. LC81 TaxID=1502850 RepID=UPI001377BC93|nr:NAD(P)/FAD-dependent oxidoreductase [Sphingopyxis sp. LC81]